MRFLHLFQKAAKSNITQTAIHLIKSLDVPVTTTSLIYTVESHPAFPSLISLSNALKQFNIDHLAMKVEEEKLEELPVPFVAHLKTGNGSFCLVTRLTAERVEYHYNNESVGRDTNIFKKEWSGIVLLAQATKNSGEKAYYTKRKNERIQDAKTPFILLVCCSLILFHLFTHWNFVGLLTLLLLVTKLIGIVVAAILLWWEVDRANPIIQQICNNDKKGNCTAVLGSKASKLFNLISWSEIGFFYFTGSFIFLLLAASYNLVALALVSVLNILALPYIFFSIYYQWRIVKQWCPLCLTVQALILLEFIVCYAAYWHVFHLPPLFGEHFISLILSFSLPVFFWLFVKPLLLKAQRSDHDARELGRLKYNQEIFYALLQKQKKLTAIPDGLGITLGNSNAKHTIIKVCNPYCGPCAKAHPLLDELLRQHDELKVQILFTATNAADDRKSKPVQHFMALYEKNDVVTTKKALLDWYVATTKDYEAFADKYRLNGELQKQGPKLQAMSDWCNLVGISFTPTYFVNGYQLPPMYQLEDLKNLL